MKTVVKIIICTMLIAFSECKKDEEPKKLECGCDSEPDEIISNINGKIEFGTSYNNPISYGISGYYGTPLTVCVDSTIIKLLNQNQITDGDSIIFTGGRKNACNDCEFCGFISITSMSKN